jgi:hypothetical protein
VDTFCDAVQADLQQLAGVLGVQSLNWQLLGNYLRMIISAIANDADRLVFGGWREDDQWAVKAMLVPLLIILQDLLLEFEGDRSNTTTLLGLIDHIFEHCKVLGEHVEDSYIVADAFPNTLNLYKRVRNLDESCAIAPSLLVVESLFPRMVGRPAIVTTAP